MSNNKKLPVKLHHNPKNVTDGIPEGAEVFTRYEVAYGNDHTESKLNAEKMLGSNVIKYAQDHDFDTVCEFLTVSLIQANLDENNIKTTLEKQYYGWKAS